MNQAVVDVSVFRPDALAGKTILVTGASRGIGAAIAVACAEVGADIAVGFRNTAEGAGNTVEAVRALGGQAEAFAADVRDPEQVETMVSDAIERFGKIDGLVNNAGVMPESRVEDMTLDEWRNVIDIDLTGAFLCSKAVLPGMIERGSGSIVMIASRLGQIGFAGVSHYAAAKAGLLAFAKSLAKEVGPKGVRVNSVAPGVTITEMTTDVVTGEVGAKRLAELPSGRFATAPEVAASVVFLMTDAAALYHGQTLGPNGGGHMP
ncbi:MAG TPA: 3-oxoacyl-ACP reductase family protein [Acidimicrobiia bacterium]|nr:3-oxoacyl-ACP reductase family protein [Acidimicrobiia bacterium]